MKRAALLVALVGAALFGFLRPDAEAAPGTGRVRGLVKLEGAAPKLAPRPITKDHAVCGHSAREALALVTDPRGGVRSAAVLLRPSGGATPPPPAVPASPVLIRQHGCDYEPHVQVVPVGTKLKIVNNDDVMHNIHAYNERGETLFNLAQPFKGLSNSYTVKAPGFLKLVCDSGHPWMRAFIVAADTPWSAVTSDDGSFAMEGVPPGTYQVELWHEYLGRSTQTVTVPAGGEAVVTFALKAPPEPFVK
jgi:plastocyanin